MVQRPPGTADNCPRRPAGKRHQNCQLVDDYAEPDKVAANWTWQIDELGVRMEPSPGNWRINCFFGKLPSVWQTNPTRIFREVCHLHRPHLWECGEWVLWVLLRLSDFHGGTFRGHGIHTDLRSPFKARFLEDFWNRPHAIRKLDTVNASSASVMV